jgi:hypothetical protein
MKWLTRPSAVLSQGLTSTVTVTARSTTSASSTSTAFTKIDSVAFNCQASSVNETLTIKKRSESAAVRISDPIKLASSKIRAGIH